MVQYTMRGLQQWLSREHAANSVLTNPESLNTAIFTLAGAIRDGGLHNRCGTWGLMNLSHGHRRFFGSNMPLLLRRFFLPFATALATAHSG